MDSRGGSMFLKKRHGVMSAAWQYFPVDRAPLIEVHV
jgi:hypothetical protein